MKTIVRYTGNTEQRLADALDDVKEYLGEKNYNMLLDAAVDTFNLTFKQLSGSMAILGIEGLPVRAFWHEVVRLRCW